jgi:NAD(P)-dependent dehydrogenase (short-subunit alcohol dehydrogenase family)
MSRTLLVTGASTGFGADVALAMAAKGWTVFASMRNPAKAAPLVDRAREAGCAGNVVPVQIDVTDAASVASGVACALEQTGGRLDALLNNAGFSVIAPFEEMTDADVRAQMETNFFGALAVTRAVLPAMRAAQCGRILTVTSNAVNTPHPMLSLYAASKWALEGWAEGLAMEVAPYGIEVGVVQPGAHRTPFASNVQFAMPEGSAYAAWLEAAGLSLGELDAWGRDPALAVAAIADLLDAPKLPFRTLVGEDTQIFAALKGAAPFEVRAMALRAITGAPAAGAFTMRDHEDSANEWPVASQIAKRVAGRLADDPELASVLAQAFRLG